MLWCAAENLYLIFLISLSPVFHFIPSSNGCPTSLSLSLFLLIYWDNNHNRMRRCRNDVIIRWRDPLHVSSVALGRQSSMVLSLLSVCGRCDTDASAAIEPHCPVACCERWRRWSIFLFSFRCRMFHCRWVEWPPPHDFVAALLLTASACLACLPLANGNTFSLGKFLTSALFPPSDLHATWNLKTHPSQKLINPSSADDFCAAVVLRSYSCSTTE